LLILVRLLTITACFLDIGDIIDHHQTMMVNNLTNINETKNHRSLQTIVFHLENFFQEYIPVHSVVKVSNNETVSWYQPGNTFSFVNHLNLDDGRWNATDIKKSEPSYLPFFYIYLCPCMSISQVLFEFFFGKYLCKLIWNYVLRNILSV
jgi:hypothetical protein